MKYITKQNDRWDLLSWKFYNDPYLYEPLLLENPQVSGYLVLPEGLQIEIPIVEDDSVQGINPPWQTD